MKRIFLFHAVIAAVAAFANTLPASTVIPARLQSTPVLLRGGTVHPVVGAVIPQGEVLFAEGRIVAIGTGLSVPAGTQDCGYQGGRFIRVSSPPAPGSDWPRPRRCVRQWMRQNWA